LNDRMATLVVVASGKQGNRVFHIALEHASFAPERRRVLRADGVTLPCGIAAGAAAVALNARDELVACLDQNQALCEAWIEDAFLRAALSA